MLSSRLKQLRLTRGLTQEQLGKMIHVTKVSICCYESGTRTPTLDTLIDLADSLNTPLSYLLGTDALAISDENKSDTINVAKDEMELIKELRKHMKLYERLLDDPKRTLEYVEKQLR
jgi:transcriptional regulator with XRE-family HTH domain